MVRDLFCLFCRFRISGFPTAHPHAVRRVQMSPTPEMELLHAACYAPCFAVFQPVLSCLFLRAPCYFRSGRAQR